MEKSGNGFLLLAEVITANVHDSKGAAMLLKDMRLYYPSVSLVKADKGYRGVDSGFDGCVVECAKSNFDTAEFRPLSDLRVVERTNSWLENFHGWGTTGDCAGIMSDIWLRHGL